MAYQRVPESAIARVIFEANNQEISVGFHARNPGGYTQTNLDQLAYAVDQYGGAAIAALMVSNHQYLRTEVTGLDSETDLSSQSAVFATAGSEGVNALPNNVSFVVSQNCGLTGRTTRGRVYLPPIPRTYVNTAGDQYDHLFSTAVSAYVNVIDGVRIAIENIGTWDAVIVSRFHNGSKRAEAVTCKWINTYANSDKVATRRSRLDR